MKLRMGLLMASMVAAPAHAQTWTPAQQAVIDRIEECSQLQIDKNMQGEIGCFHRDFVGWDNTMPAPRDHEYARAAIERRYARGGGNLIGFSIQPLSVRIIGNVAIAHYYGYSFLRTPEGVNQTRRNRWTDVLINEGGRWAWIADHGGLDPGTPPGATP